MQRLGGGPADVREGGVRSSQPEVGPVAHEVSFEMSDQAVERVLQLVDFLADYDARRNPPVHDVTAHRLFLKTDTDVPALPGIEVTGGGEAWMTVDFVELPQRPETPQHFDGILDVSAALLDRPSVAEGVEPTDADDAERWLTSEWEPWAADYTDALAVKALYRDLFETRVRLNTERESLEFVWGFGRLRWNADGVNVNHPLITVPVEVELDATTQQLTVRPGGPADIDASCIAGLAIADKPAFLAARQANAYPGPEGEEGDLSVDPWSEADLQATLRRLVHAVDHDGVLVTAPGATDAPATVDTTWVLYMRRRRPDYQGFLDQLRELYAEGVMPPDPLAAVVIDAPSSLLDDQADEGAASGDHAVPLLLPLATNEEQQRIVRLAQSRAGVTVQGPPGTGKSHTIANVISHYVAQGKRVLVTAEKEQALKVLGEKLPEGIRNLTVSVLGADDEGRRRLETAIGEIQTRVTGLDKPAADRRIAHLTTELDQLDRAIAIAADEIFRHRAAEVSRLPGAWAAGPDPTPSAAAIWVAENSADLATIPDAIPTDVEAPLGAGELSEFVSLVAEVTPRVAEDAAHDLPDLDQLPTAFVLADRNAKLDEFRATLTDAEPEITTWTKVDDTDADTLTALTGDFVDARDWRAKVAGSWVADVISAVSDPLLESEWTDILAVARADREAAMVLRRALATAQVVVPATSEPAFLRTLREAHTQLTGRGKVRLFSREARRALSNCTVNGRAATTADDVEACIRQVELDELRRRMRTLWLNRVEAAGGPALGDADAVETTLGGHLDNIERALEWRTTTWPALRNRVQAIGIAGPLDGDPDNLARLVDVITIARRRADERALAVLVEETQTYLRTGLSGPDPSPLWKLLADAYDAQLVDTWGTHRKNVESLVAIGPAAKRLRDLRQRLAGAAPVWTAQILEDPAAAGDPSLVGAAWQWRQLDGWVRTIANGDSDPQAVLEDLTTQRRRVVADLVSESAWRRLADNLNDTHRQALNSYLKAVTRYGKTGGKFAQRWITEMREALNNSKNAVPVWIMPVNRALSSFRPERTPPFDVLIIDEASQIGIHAVPLLSLARTAIVVGDDKQTSPENVGLNQQAVFDLLDDHLSAVPAYRTLFDPSNSLYDLAFQKFPDVVMLTEHFRCLPSIIEFSNTYAYDGRIIPLRDRPPRPGWVAVGAVKVSDGYRIGDVNPPEAEAVVNLVDSMCADPLYDGMTFGVVSLLATSQSKLIWDRLLDRLGPTVMAEREIRCGEAANFQGDERDVMVLCTVVATDPANPAGRIAAATRTADQRRINVAASRARNQMWVVHSVDPDRFTPGDLRRELILHCQNPGVLDTAVADLEGRCDSDFERQVVRRILAAGYRRVRVQHPVGRYRLDIVIEGPESRLAVECDGDRWHGEDVWHQDRARQQVLERAGWTFVRVRGSAFYRDPERAMAPLWQRLEELNIPRGEDWVESATRSTVRTVEVGPVDLPPAPTKSSRSWGAKKPTPAAAVTPPPVPPPVPTTPAPPTEPTAASVVSAPATSNPSAPVPTSAPIEVPGAVGSIAVVPYCEWTPRKLVDVESASADDIVSGLLEILSVEGPMHALRAYQIYTRAAGGQRVGKEMKRAFNRAVNAAIQRGVLAQIRDDLEGQIDKTLHVPGEAKVVVREHGPRALTDIPRSEVRTVIAALGGDEHLGSEWKRAVLNAFGLTKLTESANVYLDSCLTYTWS